MNEDISVLIRTYNSKKTLRELLEKLKLKNNDEIIIVDSGSNDATLSIANEFKTKIISAPQPFNYSKSLNIGFNAAHNDWILVISSHSIPLVDDFLEIHRSALLGLPQDVLVGYAPSSLDGRSDMSISKDKVILMNKSDYLKHPHICTNANAIYRKSAWIVNKFDESIKTAEDVNWLHQILDGSARFCYIPQAVCVNRNQGSLLYMFKKGQRDMRALRLDGRSSMSIRNLIGGWIRTIHQVLKHEIELGNGTRRCAHIIGQFVGSYQKPTNNVADK